MATPKLSQVLSGGKHEEEPKSKSSNDIKLQNRTPASRNSKHWWAFLKFIGSQWFLISLGLMIAIASQVQVPQRYQRAKSTAVSYTCVSIIFFLTGCTLKTRVLIDNYSRWKLHLFVQVQCFLMTSSVIFGIVSLCATNRTFMDAALLLGLLLTGCTPTTISSNVVMTGQAHGNTALTVVQSTLGNFLGPFLTPAIFTMYTSPKAWYTEVLPNEVGGYGGIYRRVFKQLGLSLFVPMAVGQLVQNLLPAFNKRFIIGWKLNKISSICLLVVVWQTYDSAFASSAFSTVKASNMIFIVFISVALFFLFLSISFFTSLIWLPREDVVSVCYCVPAKTPAMGVPLAMTMFAGLTPVVEAKLQIPMVIYQALQIVGGTIAIPFFRKLIERAHLPKDKDERDMCGAGDGAIVDPV